jgi:hypothetical protein
LEQRDGCKALGVELQQEVERLQSEQDEPLQRRGPLHKELQQRLGTYVTL